MSKELTENVANNVAQREMQDLTEQWKNGELKEGWYYLSIIPNKKCIDYFTGQDFERYNEWAIEEVLVPVPTYEELEELQESNDGLSKLMFKSLMNRFVKADEERERLEEQLNIAKKALKEAHTFPATTTLKDWCQERLKEIDEVLKCQ